MCRRVPESTPIQVLCAMAMDQSTRYDTQKIKTYLLDERFLVDVWSLGKHVNLYRVFQDVLGVLRKEEEQTKKSFAKSSFFRFESEMGSKKTRRKNKKKKTNQTSSQSLRPGKNMRLAEMLEKELSKVEERDRLQATRGEVFAIQSGRRSKGSSPVICHRGGLPEVELEHPLLMEDWQREYLYGF